MYDYVKKKVKVTRNKPLVISYPTKLIKP